MNEVGAAIVLILTLALIAYLVYIHVADDPQESFENKYEYGDMMLAFDNNPTEQQYNSPTTYKDGTLYIPDASILTNKSLYEYNPYITMPEPKTGGQLKFVSKEPWVDNTDIVSESLLLREPEIQMLYDVGCIRGQIDKEEYFD